MKLTPWQKIMRADKRGTGCRFSADEIWQLAGDCAIETRADLDDEEAIEAKRIAREKKA